MLKRRHRPRIHVSTGQLHQVNFETAAFQQATNRRPASPCLMKNHTAGYKNVLATRFLALICFGKIVAAGVHDQLWQKSFAKECGKTSPVVSV